MVARAWHVWGVGLATAVCVTFAGQAQAQLIVDLGGAWGTKERTIDAGGGWGFGMIAVVGGVAAVEHGLKPNLVWSPDKTRIYDTANNDAPVDPRDGRTTPYTRFWARAEVQPSFLGGALMWDPRNHWALGAFGSVDLAPRSQAIAELRWVHTLGYLLAFRLRFR
jgi:hypothetical protein